MCAIFYGIELTLYYFRQQNFQFDPSIENPYKTQWQIARETSSEQQVRDAAAGDDEEKNNQTER